MKKEVAGLTLWIDEFVSSHDLGVPKEQPAFWERLQDGLGFDPAGALFVDDSQAVLDAAAAFGIGSVVGIRRPDTRMPRRDAGPHPYIDSVAEWL
jgi:putative hydrolase of the HAD superfamily